MGCCFGPMIKPESPPSNGLSSKTGSDENHSSVRRSGNVSASPITPPAPQGEGGILKSSNLKRFSLSELRYGTSNFSPKNVIGEGSFGVVFKGWIDEHSLELVRPGTGVGVAVKRLNQEGLQGSNEWLTEINYLGQLHHPNLVKLIGYCFEDDHRLMVYEFLTNGSLDNHLFRRGSYFQPLSWSIRMKVALDAAKGLAYLHSDEANVIYRDFKSSDILLDSNYNAKLSDFGFTKDERAADKSHVSTRVMCTYTCAAYAAPEYIYTGYFTKMSDVYYFGVVLLEIMSGRCALDRNRPRWEQNLIDWARPYLKKKDRVLKVMDARIEGQYSLHQAMKVAHLAEKCLSRDPRVRPKMDEVVRALEKIQSSSNDTVGEVETS